jgi:molybdate transport system substrate-binding protein
MGGGRLALGDPDHVPVGIYAKQALKHFGIWNALRTHLAPQTNVKNVAFLVKRGESPFGIVYRTDAISDATLQIITEFPEASHDRIEYVLGAFNANDAGSAAAFGKFLLSENAKLVFRKFGFIPLEKGTT